MIAEPRVWVDIESAIREWARDSVSEVERRVFFGPKGDAEYPQIVVMRIGGPDDDCLIQFDVWGAKNGGKGAAGAIAAKLATAADALARYTHDGILLHGAQVISSRWLPDFESDQPRYVIDVTFTATASGE